MEAPTLLIAAAEGREALKLYVRTKKGKTAAKYILQLIGEFWVGSASGASAGNFAY